MGDLLEVVLAAQRHLELVRDAHRVQSATPAALVVVGLELVEVARRIIGGAAGATIEVERREGALGLGPGLRLSLFNAEVARNGCVGLVRVDDIFPVVLAARRWLELPGRALRVQPAAPHALGPVGRELVEVAVRASRRAAGALLVPPAHLLRLGLWLALRLRLRLGLRLGHRIVGVLENQLLAVGLAAGGLHAARVIGHIDVDA
mmetsp:Transcript_90174/g.232781  ORF Transcript_90174/g.232781 Transcript_90174/m.232781 type:complete len:205 (-) Transcript_90174:569-1183(-)